MGSAIIERFVARGTPEGYFQVNGLKGIQQFSRNSQTGLWSVISLPDWRQQ